MKFPIYLVAGAGLVSALPLRVVVISEIRTTGLAGPHKTTEEPAVAHMVNSHSGKSRMSCASRFREKALEMSNAFRQALGLPKIETTQPTNVVKILPFMGTAPTFIEVSANNVDGKTKGGDPIKIVSGPVPHRHHAHHAHHMSHMKGKKFLARVHHALMVLGPWEGRAVAFVLGCGLGVLLRMLWVLALVSYRMIRGDRQEPEYQHIVFEHYDAEDVVLAPPHYVYNDEKVPVVEEPKTVAEEAK